MTPQLIHDLWLVITAVSAAELTAIVIFKLRMYRVSGRYYFLSQAILLMAVIIEQVCAEAKNYAHPAPPDDPALGLLWLAGRALETVVAAGVLGYMVFGRNGKQAHGKIRQEDDP